MNHILTMALAAFLSGAAAFALWAGFKLPEKRVLFERIIPVKKSCLGKTGLSFLIISALAALFLTVISVLISTFTFTENNISVWSASVICCLVQTSAILYMTDSKGLFRIFGKLLIAGLAILLCEVFIFNMKSFTAKPMQEEISLNTAQIEGEGRISGNKISVRGNTDITFEAPPEFTKGLVFDMEQQITNESLPFEVSVRIKDDNMSESFEIAQDKFTMAAGYPFTASVNPYGQLHAVRLCFSNVSKWITINSITAVNALPFDFSALRFFVLLTAFALIIIIKELKLYRIVFDGSRTSHNIAVQAAVLLLAVSSVVFLNPYEGAVPYEQTAALSINDPFSYTFDAFQKGQVYLDLDPDPKLAELDNVYDKSLREAEGAAYHWDYAYYDGHYYCYFGAAPVVTFYYPYYMITGKVPSLEMASIFFGILAVFFFCQTLIVLCRKLVPKINLLMLILLMTAGVSCAGIYTCMNQVSRYSLPILSGMFWLFLCLWAGITACSEESAVRRIAKLFVSGASLAFCAGSRPGTALLGLVLLPFFIGILRDKTMSVKYKTAQAGSFLVPVISGAAVIMWYNAARFGSPFDFGAAYQLTVSDVHANTVMLSGIFPMLYHYFLQLPRPKGSFPFIEPNFCVLYNYTRYTYLGPAIGAFTYPLITIGMLFVPAAVSRKNCLQTEKSSYILRKWVLLLGIGLCLIIGWLNFCMAGAVDRYILDFLPVLAICAAAAILYALGRSEGYGMKYKLSAAGAVLTIVISWLLLIGVRDSSLIRHFPNIYDAAEDLLIFWQ
ncbi:MAG: hypothetical protein PUA84_07035 [Oscillospiraceae bacterium]|nr:hypothetical protein [Oscillospiraceae bacterium]